MNFEVDDLLDHVDEWKFQLYEKLRTMTKDQRAAFWKQAVEQARALELSIAEPDLPAERAGKRGARGRTS